MEKLSREQLLKTHHPDAIKQRLRQQPKTQHVSDAILGGIDGCITTFAIVCGVFGAGFSASVALVLGLANLLADGFSMAVSNYEAIKAQQEFKDEVRKTEEKHIDEVPEGEREEIRQIFAQKGFAGETLNKIVATITQDRELWIETMLREEHGLPDTPLNPYKSAITTFAAFLLVGAVPLLPYIVPVLDANMQFMLSVLLAGVMFFLIGMLKSLIFAKPPLRSAFSTLLNGGIAAGLAFLTGYLLRQMVGIV